MSGKFSGRILLRAILATIVCLVSLGCYGFSITLHHDTLINGWWPLGISAAVAIITSLWGWQLWKWLTDMRAVWVNCIVHIIVTTSVLLLLFYSINYYGSRPSSEITRDVEITSRYYKIHHHSNRTGRHSYSRGAPYKVYFIQITFPSGRTKDLQLPYSEYRRLHKGSHLSLQLQRGFFGIPVIKNLHHSIADHPAPTPRPRLRLPDPRFPSTDSLRSQRPR